MTEPKTSGPLESLKLAAEILIKKSADYQNDKSRVRQADYYPRGVMSIMDIIHTKYLRATSLLEKAEQDGGEPNFESIEDTFIDMCNYCAIAAAWCRGEIDGQKLMPYDQVNLFSNRNG